MSEMSQVFLQWRAKGSKSVNKVFVEIKDNRGITILIFFMEATEKYDNGGAKTLCQIT